LGLGDLIAEHLSDSRRGKNTQLPVADLFSPSTAARQAMRTSMMPSGSPKIRRSG